MGTKYHSTVQCAIPNSSTIIIPCLWIVVEFLQLCPAVRLIFQSLYHHLRPNNGLLLEERNQDHCQQSNVRRKYIIRIDTWLAIVLLMYLFVNIFLDGIVIPSIYLVHIQWIVHIVPHVVIQFDMIPETLSDLISHRMSTVNLYKVIRTVALRSKS